MKASVLDNPSSQQKRARVSIDFAGLCHSCTKMRTCTFPRNSAAPIVQCEEFEGFEPVKNSLVSMDHPIQRRTHEPETPALGGLCRMCDLKTTCTFPKPQGGIWHCEEYR